MKHLSTAILSVVLLMTPLALWAERTNKEVWDTRLIIPTFIEEPNRHTPKEPTGTYLPGIITKDTIFDSAAGPYSISNATTIAKNVTVTIRPGTTIRFHEFGRLENNGTLIAQGTPAQPILFTTNETHPLNQTWSGIITAQDATTIITQATIEYASPGITCLPGSHVNLQESTISNATSGAYLASETCVIRNSTIQATLDGISTTLTAPHLTNTVIVAGRQAIHRSAP